ncbi:WD40-repeat-containing domain protein [Dipodascopsis uninucleata]
MPSRDNVHVLVARYLRDNGYGSTLDVFKNELGLDDDMIPSDHSMTLESIIEQKKMFDLANAMEEVSLDGADPEKEWHVPFPSFKTVLPKQQPESNILFITVAKLLMNTVIDDLSSPLSPRVCILVTSADQSLRIFDFYSLDLLKVHTHLHSSPILVLHVLDESTILSGGMDGRLVASNPASGDILLQVRDHNKYLVRIAVSSDGKYLATASYDKKVYVYNISHSPSLSLEKLGTLTFPTNPEAVIFVTVGGDGEEQLRLIVSRRDSTFLYYYKLQPTVIETARHNLNPESNSWVSFCAMDIISDPADPKFIGVATSTVPHMRFMVLEAGIDNIIQNAFTKAPQDSYSTARICFRPQGSGIWCNGDDGVIRGLEVSSGNVVAELKHHDGKVKAMYSGIVDGREVLITGGFDKSVVIWELEQR